MAYRTRVTAKKRAKFLEVLADTANVTKASDAIGIDRFSLYRIRDKDEEFRLQWDEAVERGTNRLEDEAVRRATEGWDEPVFYLGQQTGMVRKFSDTLLIFMLKARRPEKFRERIEQQHTGKDGAPLAPPVISISFEGGGPGK